MVQASDNQFFPPFSFDAVNNSPTPMTLLQKQLGWHVYDCTATVVAFNTLNHENALRNIHHPCPPWPIAKNFQEDY